MINKRHEMMRFMKSKNHGSDQKSVIWKDEIKDLSCDLLMKPLGGGDYGVTSLLIGPRYDCRPSKEIKIVRKSIIRFDMTDVKQLNQINMYDKAKISEIVDKTISDIFCTEVASMVCTNYLINHRICLNFPYFFGVQKASSSHNSYMYMQFIPNEIFKAMHNNFDSIFVQATMAIMSMYQIKLVHGDINPINMRCMKLSKPKHLLYQRSGRHYMTEPTRYIFYFIDLGMGFIDGKLMPAPRLEKDKARHNYNISWDADKLKDEKEIKLKHPFEAYKGYYYEEAEKDIAYLRRHLLDLYLFLSYMPKYSCSPHIKITRNIFISHFYNPGYYINQAIKNETKDHPIRPLHYYPHQILTELYEKILHQLRFFDLTPMNQIDLDKLPKDDLIDMGSW